VSAPLIELEELRFAYGAEAVLHGVAFRVERGEVFGLVGADGAGKTTLLRLAVGQLAPAGGRVRVLGGAPADPRLRARVAYMPQGFGLYTDLSVAENLAFFADLHGLRRDDAQARAADLLRRTGLAGFEARRAGQLSGGMMQKLALACALMSRPEVMCLDEPTTGVDPLSRRAFWELLDGVRAEGMTILYATANMDEAERCDRVAILEAGRIVHQGAPEALARVEGSVLVAVSGPGARGRRGAVAALDGVEQVFPVGARLHAWLSASTPPVAFAAALARIDPALAAEPASPTLQDAVLRLALGDRREERA